MASNATDDINMGDKHASISTDIVDKKSYETF